MKHLDALITMRIKLALSKELFLKKNYEPMIKWVHKNGPLFFGSTLAKVILTSFAHLSLSIAQLQYIAV